MFTLRVLTRKYRSHKIYKVFGFQMISNKIWEKLLLIAMFVIGFSVVTLVVIELYDVKCPTCPIYEDLTPTFLKIVQHLNDERNLMVTHYDCDNISRELVRRLQLQGFDAQYVEGWFNDTIYGYHAWVSINLLIEATTGELVRVEDYNKYQKVK